MWVFFITKMRQTFTSLKAAHFRNIGKSDQITDTELLADFQYSLSNRYQLIFASLAEYINSEASTDTTVASTQYYDNPIGLQSLDSVTVTVGSVVYPLTTIYSQHTWDLLNAIQIQPSTIPQFLFPRQYDYGIWPIPQDAYTITINSFMRDRSLSIEDYTDSTVTMTVGDETVLGSATTFTAAMAGRWLKITSATSTGQGYWYKIASVTDTTHLELTQKWTGATAASLTYIIGETPELPEEAHVLLPDGTAADYYTGLRNDVVNGTAFNNKFWTGDPNNNERDIDSKNVLGGLIGLVKRYKNRDRKILIRRNPNIGSGNKIWSQTIS